MDRRRPWILPSDVEAAKKKLWKENPTAAAKAARNDLMAAFYSAAAKRERRERITNFLFLSGVVAITALTLCLNLWNQ
jgi:hypothetical protein